MYVQNKNLDPISPYKIGPPEVNHQAGVYLTKVPPTTNHQRPAPRVSRWLPKIYNQPQPDFIVHPLQ